MQYSRQPDIQRDVPRPRRIRRQLSLAPQSGADSVAAKIANGVLFDGLCAKNRAEGDSAPAPGTSRIVGKSNPLLETGGFPQGRWQFFSETAELSIPREKARA